MKGKIWLLVTILFFGCTHTSIVKTDSESFKRFELEVKKKDSDAKVVLKDNQSYPDVRLVRLSTDSVSWVSQDGNVVSLPTNDIVEIRFMNRGRGVFEGLGIGLGIGSFGGLLIGAIAASAGGGSMSGGDVILITTGVLGGSFGFLGLLMGAGAGSEDVYLIEPDSAHVIIQQVK